MRTANIAVSPSAPRRCHSRYRSWWRRSACSGRRPFPSPSSRLRIVRRSSCSRRGSCSPACVMLGVAAICRRAAQAQPPRSSCSSPLLGIANQAVYLGLSYVGMRSISSGLAALVISANPVLTAVMAAAFLDERMTWRKAMRACCSASAVSPSWSKAVSPAASTIPSASRSRSRRWSRWSPAPSCSRSSRPRAGSGSATACKVSSAGLATLPFAFAFESVGDIVPSWRLAAALAYLALFVSVFAYLLWFHLLTVSGATAASSYHFMMPPLGMLFGWLLLGEQVALDRLDRHRAGRARHLSRHASGVIAKWKVRGALVAHAF